MRKTYLNVKGEAEMQEYRYVRKQYKQNKFKKHRRGRNIRIWSRYAQIWGKTVETWEGIHKPEACGVKIETWGSTVEMRGTNVGHECERVKQEWRNMRR